MHGSNSRRRARSAIRADPQRMSTGSLPMGGMPPPGAPMIPGHMSPEMGAYYDGRHPGPPGFFPPQSSLPPPAHYSPHLPPAPAAPLSGQPTPYSTHPPSPTSSSEQLFYNPPVPAPAPAPPPPAPQQYQAPPQQQPMMRPDAGLGRRNTTGARPVYEPPEYDYRQNRPVIHAHAAARDLSPSESGPFVVIPNSGGNVHRSQSYRPGSSGMSDGSYEAGDYRLQGQKGYLVSAGGERQPRRRRAPSQDQYQVAALHPPPSEHHGRGTLYHLDGPPRRRERSMSRPAPPRQAISDDELYDEPPRRSRSLRRITNGPAPTMSGALVRPRSRSASERSHPGAGALIRRASDQELAPPSNGTIRLEYGGQAIDIAYTGHNGKPLVGNITINTTARTISTDPQSSQQQQQQQQQQLALPAISPSQQPLALPPPDVQPVVVPPPPQPGRGQAALPAPPRRSDHDSSGADSPPFRGRGPRDDLYQSMANLTLDHSPPPPGLQPGRPNIHDDLARGRRPIEMPPPPVPNARSRSRPPPQQDHEGPLWTKITRNIVSKRAVLARGYEFEETRDAIIIYRVLTEPEIDELVDLSERIRRGEVQVRPRERAPSTHRRRRRSSSAKRERRRDRPMSIHGYPGGMIPDRGGPGPSKERPPPGKPAIVKQAAPPAPSPPPPQAQHIQPMKTGGSAGGGLRENPDSRGTYVGYTMRPKGR